MLIALQLRKPVQMEKNTSKLRKRIRQYDSSTNTCNNQIQKRAANTI